MGDYDAVQFWGNELQSTVSEASSDYVVSILRMFDVSTCNGIRDLSAFAIEQLQNNRVPATQDAIDLWQVSQCLKKFRYGGTPISEEEMMEGWISRNRACSEPFQGSEWLVVAMRELLLPLDPPFLAALEETGRFGNGAVYEGMTSIGRWNALEAFPYNVCDPDDVRWWRSSSATAARLCCVPKDMFKLRSITVEPAEATFLQQLTRRRLLRAVQVLPRSSGIPQQLYGAGPEIQRARALRGSLTGSLATIDLSDASDSIRMDIVARVMPPAILAALERARSTYVEVNGTRHRCHMFAGMGNATTFIVESLYFWALCTALSKWLRCLTPVSVFGDDIVLSRKVATHPLFLHEIEKFGLKVNRAKSGLSEGPGFREACGLVAYQGTVLPLLRINGYRVDKPDDLVSLCSLISDGLDECSVYAPFVRKVMQSVGARLVSSLHLPVVPYRLLAAGCYIADPSETVGQWSYRCRWNPEVQHPEVRVRVLRELEGKTLLLRSLTPGEVQGVLAGQLHTEFHDAPLGYHPGRRSKLRLPSKELKLTSQWVPCWGGGQEVLDLMSES